MGDKYNAAKMAIAYLTLWKALDLYFPESRWSEIVETKHDEMKAEVQRLCNDDLSWAKDPAELRYDIESTVSTITALERERKSPWHRPAAGLRDMLRDRALKYAGEIQLVASAGGSSVSFY